MSPEERLRLRARIIRAVRAFFDDQDFIEVDTWVAISAPAPEPHIETAKVALQIPNGTATRYLQPSPEMQMKRVMPHAPRIYQIAPVFRQGDLSPRHTPEFRLLEWYRRGAPWTQLLDDCEGLLRACAAAAGGSARIDVSRPFSRISMEQAFRENAGFSILESLERDTLLARLRERKVHFATNDSWNDLFHRVFLTHVEPKLARLSEPFFLYGYPAPLQMYSRLSPEDPRVSERFELYVGDLELANGYGELVDPRATRQRFAADAAARRDTDMQTYPIDERFFTALGELPDSAGIALGVDRLLMLMMGVDHIDAIAAVPWSEA